MQPGQLVNLTRGRLHLLPFRRDHLLQPHSPGTLSLCVLLSLWLKGTITEAHCTSTKALYEHKWKAFEAMAGTSSRLLLLHHKFRNIQSTGKLKGSILASYLAALNSVIATMTGPKFVTVAELQALICSYKLVDQSPTYLELDVSRL